MMENELKQALDRLSAINLALEDPEAIQDMTWYSYFDSNDKIKVVYIFRSSSDELLIAKNGKVLEGSWALLTNTNSLLIEKGQGKELYNIAFIEGHYLILSKDGTADKLLLINQAYYQRILELAPQSVEKVINKDLDKLLPAPEIPSIDASIDFEDVEPKEEEVESIIIENQSSDYQYNTIEDDEVPTTEAEDTEVIEEQQPEVIPAFTGDDQEEEERPLSLLEKLQKEKGVTEELIEEDEEEDETVYPFKEQKTTLNDKLKEKLQKEKQHTLLDKLSDKVKKKQD